MMRVARTATVDARMVNDGGIGTYLQQLLPRVAGLLSDWRFTLLGDPEKFRALGWDMTDSFRFVPCHARIFSVREQLDVARLSPSDCDLFWSPNYGIPLLSQAPLVVTIHDVNHIALPELMGSVLRRRYASWLLRTAVSRAREVLYVSDFTRREAMRLLGVGAARGTVAHNGVDDQWRTAREHAPQRPLAQPYLLYVGNIKRHKNVPFLLRAFARVVDRLPHQLILIGRTEGLRADPEVAPALARLGGRALMLGELDERQLLAYVAHAEALVTASLYEGFGLPALEAMAAGTPCVVSSAGSLPEICGDAALFADPRDEEAFAHGLLQLAGDPLLRASLVARGRQRALQFSWDRCAQLTAAVLQRCAASVAA